MLVHVSLHQTLGDALPIGGIIIEQFLGTIQKKTVGPNRRFLRELLSREGRAVALLNEESQPCRDSRLRKAF